MSATTVIVKIKLLRTPALLYLPVNVRRRVLALGLIFTYLVTQPGPFRSSHRRLSCPFGGLGVASGLRRVLVYLRVDEIFRFSRLLWTSVAPSAQPSRGGPWQQHLSFIGPRSPSAISEFCSPSAGRPSSTGNVAGHYQGHPGCRHGRADAYCLRGRIFATPQMPDGRWLERAGPRPRTR